MPRLNIETRRAREEGLLAAAQDEFSEFGYSDASIGGIARRAGVSDGLLYRYFADKRAILTAVLDRFFGSIIETAESRVMERGTFAEQLECLIENQLNVFSMQPRICELFLRHSREHEDYVGSPLQARARRYTDLMIRIVNDAKAAGTVSGDLDERILRDLVYGGIEHIAWRTVSNDKPLDVERTAKQLTRLVLSGVEPRQGS